MRLISGALSSHPTPCTRYDKCAQELEQLVLSIYIKLPRELLDGTRLWPVWPQLKFPGGPV